MKRSVSVLLLAVFLSFATSASAIRRHRWVHYEPSIYLTPSLGIISFSSDFDDFTGFHQVSDGIIGLDLSFRVVNGLGIGFEVADVPTAGDPVFVTSRGGDVVFLNFNMFYDLPTQGPVSPFVKLGIGRMEIQYPITRDEGFTTFSMGGGINARVHRHAGVQFSVRHFRSFLNADELNNTQFTGGISFIF
ncbi:MAG: outer membrane beta-barrel protein [Candidatus Glassbacteria bacterium]